MADHFEEHAPPNGAGPPPQPETTQSGGGIGTSDRPAFEESYGHNDAQPTTPAYSSSSDPYGTESEPSLSAAVLDTPAEQAAADTAPSSSAQLPAKRIPPPPPPPPPPDDGEGDEEE